MAKDRIGQLRSVQFPTERRGGYDRRAVDDYLGQIADWLETGGEDEARQALVQREMERVGERTGSILAAAQESAEAIGAEARAAAERLRSEAEREAAEARSAADAYAAETRSAADEHARKVGEEAATAAKATREEADAYAKQAVEQADERLRTAESEAAARTRGIEEEIAGLVRERRRVVANLEQLTAELKLAIEGPGSKDLALSERVEEAADQEPATAQIPGPDSAGEHPIVEQATATYDADVPDSQPDAAEGAPTGDADPGDDRSVDPADDLDDERELERRRRAYDATEQPTEDTKLTELL